MPDIGSVTVQVLSAASGTYTPTANMLNVLAILIGGGAGGESGIATDEVAGGGGAGGAVIELYTAATIGASQPFAVGASVAADLNGNATSLGTAAALANAPGGLTGLASFGHALGGAGGAGTGGNLNIKGQAGENGFVYSTSQGHGGQGGSSLWGGGGASGGSNTVGGAGGPYGSGGAGGHATGTPNMVGGSGSAGVIYMIEFVEAGSGRIMSSLAGPGGLASHGGLAGAGGGLAG